MTICVADTTRGEDTKRNFKHAKPVLKVLFVPWARMAAEATSFNDPRMYSSPGLAKTSRSGSQWGTGS
jgi:hypothetical protein